MSGKGAGKGWSKGGREYPGCRAKATLWEAREQHEQARSCVTIAIC